jgi:hypothetical protein
MHKVQHRIDKLHLPSWRSDTLIYELHAFSNNNVTTAGTSETGSIKYSIMKPVIIES